MMAALARNASSRPPRPATPPSPCGSSLASHRGANPGYKARASEEEEDLRDFGGGRRALDPAGASGGVGHQKGPDRAIGHWTIKAALTV